MRMRRLDPVDPVGEPVDTLTAGTARRRRAPIDHLLAIGDYRAADEGYEIQVPRSDSVGDLASAFVEEEAACCPSFAFTVTEHDDAIVIVARHGALPAA